MIWIIPLFLFLIWLRLSPVFFYLFGEILLLFGKMTTQTYLTKLLKKTVIFAVQLLFGICSILPLFGAIEIARDLGKPMRTVYFFYIAIWYIWGASPGYFYFKKHYLPTLKKMGIYPDNN